MRKYLAILSLPILAVFIAAPVSAQEISAVVLPNPVGWPEIIFVLGLVGFALWKRSWIRILLSICIIIWGVFAVQYDIKIGAPLIAIGVVLFFLALFRIWRGRDLANETIVER